MTEGPGPLMAMAALHLYGILIAAALAIAVFLCTLEERRLRLPRDTGLDIVLYAVPPALVAARLYYVAFTWDQFRDRPLEILYFWQGGLAIYGGVIGGALGVWLLSRRRRLPFMLLADIVAPALLLGQAIGRWGNYFNGEAFGYQVSDPRLQFFPFAVQTAGAWHLATFFYESMWNLLGFIFLYLNRRRFQRPGSFGHVFLWYLLWYGLGRMLIEGLRTDSLMLMDIRVSQLLSLLLCAAAGLKLAWDLKGRSFMLPLPLLALASALIIRGWAGIWAACGLFALQGALLYGAYGRPDPA